MTVETEHKLEAVFTSFSQFGKWDPQQMVLPQHDVKGMGGLKFLSVCRRAGLVDDDCVTPRLIRDLFSVHKDTVRNASPQLHVLPIRHCFLLYASEH